MFGSATSTSNYKPKNTNHLHAYRGLICRIIPKERFTNNVFRVEILFQKQKNYLSLVSHLDKNNTLGVSQIKHNIRKAFIKQCGNQFNNTNSIESPPLIPVKPIAKTAFIFLIPQIFNSWHPNPAVKQKFIDYTNTNFQVNNKPYSLSNGYVWINISDFNDYCVSNQNQTMFERHTATLICKNIGSIGDMISYKLKTAYNRLLTTAYSVDILISQDPCFQVKVSVDYKTSKVRVTFSNISNNPIQLAITGGSNPNDNTIALTSVEFPINNLKTINKSSVIHCNVDYSIKGFFSYKDLPYIDIMYKTNESLHRSRFKLPIFLYKYCEILPIHDVKANAADVQKELGNFWQQLPTEGNFDIPMGAFNDKQQKKIYDDLRIANLPVCVPFDGFIPIFAKISTGACLILLKLENNNGNGILKVTSKYSEPNLFESLCEVIYGLTSINTAFETSLLDTPPLNIE